MRAALGHGALRSSKRGWITRGTARVFGLEHEAEFLFEPDGAFRLETRGKLPQVIGFDGETAWSEDRSGLRREVMLEDRDRWTLVNRILSGSWLAQDDLRLVPDEGDGRATIAVSWPDGGLAVGVELDPETWLPRELRLEGGSSEVVWRLEDWRTTAGFRFPHAWTRTEEGERADTYAFGPLEPAPDYFLDPYALRRFQPDDVRFDPGVGAELELRRARTGHLLVHPRVDGRDVGWFLFDTGAGAMCLDSEVADELELPAFGELTAVGAGGRAKTGFRRAASLTLGPVTLEHPFFVELDLSAIGAGLGLTVGGIVGYDFLARCVVELEVEGPRLTVHDPGVYRNDDAPWQPLLLSGGLPCVPARFEDHRGLFKIDTGATDGVSFHGAATEALGLLEGRDLRLTLVGGVGGLRGARIGRLEGFELAGHRFEKPRATFAVGSSGGPFVDGYPLGKIGQDFLAPFRLVLDYPHDRLAFVPR